MRRSPGWIAIAALLLAAGGRLGGAADAGAEGPTYSVEIEPGVSPRMQPAEVVELLRPEYRAKVLSLQCMKSTSFPTWGEPEGAKLIWRVRVGVPFWRTHYNTPTTRSDTTTYIVDDAIRAILGRGTGI